MNQIIKKYQKKKTRLNGFQNISDNGSKNARKQQGQQTITRNKYSKWVTVEKEIRKDTDDQ